MTPGSSIICTVTADDGDGGTATASALATVVNSAPTILSVVISPDVGVVAGETLTCTAVATDPDGDAVSISYEWQNLTTMAAATSGQTYAVIGGTDSPDDVLQCTATATDARGASATGTDSVIVENTDPVVTVVNITPTGPYNDSTVTCLATVTDADMSSVSICLLYTSPSPRDS